MTVFERPDDGVLVLLSSGNLAGTQAVVRVLKQRAEVMDVACVTRSAPLERQPWLRHPL